MSFALFTLISLSVPASGGTPGVTSFTDGTFDNADWQAISIDFGGSSFGDGAQVQAGNPVPGRKVQHSLVSGGLTTNLWVQHTKLSAVYDPAVEGPISQIGFAIDYEGTGDVQRVWAFLEQGGRFYGDALTTNVLVTSGTDWQTLGPVSIGASDFVEQFPDGTFDFNSHPDFSATGAPITFGFVTSNSSGGSYTNAVDYDNFRIGVNALPSATLVRAGSPPNPVAFVPGSTSGPVIGTTWDPFIDHTSFVPGATMDFAIYSALPGNTPTNFGMFLCAQIEEGIMLPAGQQFAFVVPDNLLLVGQTYCFQGASLDPLQGVLLTNALDVTIGSF